MSLPDGKVIGCQRIVRNCPLEIAGVRLNANSLAFHLLGFDVILGMDWLSEHYAKIGCRKKEITFEMPEEERSCVMKGR